MAKNILVLEGTALWAKVFEPDTKFNPLGDYSINLQMPIADSVAMAVCEEVITSFPLTSQLSSDNKRASVPDETVMQCFVWEIAAKRCSNRSVSGPRRY